MSKPKTPLILTSSQNQLFEIVATNANKKYYFFPQIFEKVDNNKYIEKSLNEIPEGIKKYVLNKLENPE